MDPEQKPPHCNASWKHSCFGQCHGGKRHLGDARALKRVCDGIRPGSGLRALLESHVRPPACSLTFVGDSVLQDMWTAAVLGAPGSAE